MYFLYVEKKEREGNDWEGKGAYVERGGKGALGVGLEKEAIVAVGSEMKKKKKREMKWEEEEAVKKMIMMNLNLFKAVRQREKGRFQKKRESKSHTVTAAKRHWIFYDDDDD